MNLKTFLFLLLLIPFQVLKALTPLQCGDYLLTEGPKRSLNEINEIKIGSYNVLNLEQSPGQYKVIDGVKQFVPERLDKPEWQTKLIANAIKEKDLDFLVMQEVEGIAALEKFNLDYLDNKYLALCYKGNDGRGIDIGFLIKKDMPFYVQYESFKNIKWNNPLKDGKEELLFSRDLPVLKVYFNEANPPQGPPNMILLGTHFKSQRPTAGDPTSETLRKAQAQKAAEIINHLKTQHGQNAPIMMMGDFNADINSGQFSNLKRQGFMEDVFDVKNLSPEERITHTYHPRDGATQNNQLDAILINPSLKNAVLEAKVYRYKDANGVEKPLPKTYEERSLNPSDHFMIYMTLQRNKLQ